MMVFYTTAQLQEIRIDASDSENTEYLGHVYNVTGDV